LWSRVSEQFDGQKVRLGVARRMLEYGIRVSDDCRLFIGGLEVDYSALARDVGADRRVVKQTAEQIRGDDFLYSIFSKITPFGASLLPVVSRVGYSAIVIEADPRAAGIISAAAGVLAKHKIVIRQALAADPDVFPDAKLTLIVQGQVPGNVIAELNAFKMVKSVTVMK
jgi:predicted regulator of amino acid metabolism with ACT domain